MQIKILIIPIVLSLVSCTYVPEQVGQRTETTRPSGRFDETSEGADNSAVSAQRYGDLYERLRHGMQWNHNEHRSQVRHLRQWYANKQNGEYMRRVMRRGSRYLYHILEELEKRGLPTELALVPLVESAFQPYAMSHKYASGLWQFIPATGQRYGLKQNDWYDGRYDPVEATEAALNYLQDLNKEFNGNWPLALAGYNWGERNVHRSMRKNKARGKATDFWSIRKPRETANYVASILAVASLLKDPSQYGLRLDPIPDKPYFSVVPLAHPIDIGLAATLSGVDMKEMYHLNAGYKDWFVSKDSGNGRLLMPIDKAQAFMKRLRRLDNDKWLRWKTIKSANQEGMESIASAYGISSRWLRKVNKLPTTGSLPAGTDIRIPQPAYADKHYASRRPTGGWAGLRRDGTRNWHTVRRGESIWSISRRYTISMKQLKRWNPKLARQRFLQPGQKVAVWLPKKPVVRKSRERPASGMHTVRRGESLSRIAQRYGTSIRDLAQWNDLATNAKLQIGQSLRIGKSAGKMASAGRNDSIRYTVRKGDSLWSIAQRYRVTIKKLLAWNNFNRPPRFLQPGQRLTIRR